MKKAIISVLGTDRPGIMAAISRTLSDRRCNIEDVSQTILQNQFAGVVIVSLPGELAPRDLEAPLADALHPLGLDVHLKALDAVPPQGQSAAHTQPFIVTTMGADRIGLIAGMSEVMASFRANIVNLKAVFRGGDDPHRNTMIYEVDVPLDIDQAAFRKALRDRAAELGLDLSLQHRNIFDALHRI